MRRKHCRTSPIRPLKRKVRRKSHHRRHGGRISRLHHRCSRVLIATTGVASVALETFEDCICRSPSTPPRWQQKRSRSQCKPVRKPALRRRSPSPPRESWRSLSGRSRRSSSPPQESHRSGRSRRYSLPPRESHRSRSGRSSRRSSL